MLAILTTHPIQYQVPLWQMLARQTSIPFEVWYLSDHATKQSRDREFGQTFSWDIGMLEDHPHRFLQTAPGASPNKFWRCRISESLPDLFRKRNVSALWINGWQVAAYWQAAWAAKRAGVKVWLRGESNNLEAETLKTENLKGESRKKVARHLLKQAGKKFLLDQLFQRVDHFLCIGTANSELYRSYGVPEAKLHMALYAVDNDRFRRQAEAIRGQRTEIRSQWGIPEDAFCVLFCGKFIPKKRPMDLVRAASLLITENSITNPPKDGFAVANNRPLHLLFVGSGELGQELREASHVVFDAEADRMTEVGDQRSEKGNPSSDFGHLTSGTKPTASFAGFLNQTEISRAYVAADCLVLPSDYSETWGLVVNEAMASGLPCIISDHCGCAWELANLPGNLAYPCGDTSALRDRILSLGRSDKLASKPPSMEAVCAVAESLWI